VTKSLSSTYIASLVSRNNDKGIKHLESANYRQAILVFCKSLGLVKQLIFLHQQQQEVNGENDRIISPLSSQSSAAQPVPAYFLQRTERAYETTTASCSTHNNGNDDHYYTNDNHFVFKSPIIYNEQEVQRGCRKPCAALSYIILYNLALAYHLQAIKDGFSRKQDLRKSLWLYDAANSVRMQENLSLTVIQSMAIVNNIGHVHSVLRNKGKATLCFKHLLRLIMVVNAADGEESLEELDGFLMNVTSLILAAQTCAVAA